MPQPTVTFRRLLVANRGEIAVRIFRTCERLGIETVAVAAPDDRDALHARRAGAVEDVQSYLDAGEIIVAARRAGADAVHPGYGFLAENADFAEAVVGAGLAWIGPEPGVLAASGDKLEAKRAAERAGVPVVPTGSPEEIGFPLMIKAAAGGGGRGMRVVRSAEELDEAVAAARREARAGFGDDRLFFERYLERPRHVEVQLLGDVHGLVLSLGERECSVQRRHQKVLEESPSPAVGDDVRAALGEAAVALARALRYTNAGTAEFLLDGPDFYFLELNARIQVEHPVTEEVLGLDLVEEQLLVAEGRPLDPEPPDPRGHAIEVRLYAEHPLTFLPQAGALERLELPDEIRVDAGVEAGDPVPVSYDPMIAKLVARADDRNEALARLAVALGRTRVSGVTTNLPFLRWLVSHPDVGAGRTTTAFLDEHPPLSEPFSVPEPWAGFWRLNRNAGAPPPARSGPPQVEAAAHDPATSGAGGTVSAPMPGTVIQVLAAEGERVQARQPIVVLEAMKMETPLVSPFDAVVRRVHVAVGDQVAGGAVLVELEE